LPAISDKPIRPPDEPLDFQQPVLVYLPCYNCEAFIADTISNIPVELHSQIECLVVDNQSTDRTADIVRGLKNGGNLPFKVSLVQTTENLRYAGSQKLAYALAREAPPVSKVIMLHGDGQYDPKLLSLLQPYLQQEYGLVNGYRHKPSFPDQEETPTTTYTIIKILSFIESLLTGIRQKEWHSGFVMYDTRFLSKVPLEALSTTRHIDGEFLICAGVLGEKTKAIPIYKRYEGYEEFKGAPRVQYLFDVAKVVWRYWLGYYHRVLDSRT
jgi:glycosyltransferase involved in cell wall biosynthesis